ncbi:MAG: hypothetical protein ABJC36_07730 [Gemmatimonadales bacterium]
MTESAAPTTRRRWWLILLGLLIIPLVLFTLYVGLAFSWSYSEGERAGILQKFSRRGWICKTYEGELAMSIVPGVTPTIWEFTVRNEAVVPHLSAALGKRVVLHYTEHPGIPTTCFGHTGYFVDSVSVIP